MKFVSPVIAFCVLLGGAVAHADDWGTVGIVSSTLGNNANRVCVGAPGTTRPGDIGCSSDAPYVDLTTGNVGIGTTNPIASLHVAGGTPLAPDASGSSTFVGLRVGTPGFSTALDFGTQPNISPIYSWIQSRQRNNYAINYNLALQPNGGNVGIGNTAPSATLHVTGTVSTTDAIQVGTSSLSCSSGIPGAIRYNSGSLELCDGSSWDALGGGSALSLSDTDGDTKITVENTGDTDTISFTTAGTERMVIDESGNVGIGTSDPNLPLTLVANSNGFSLRNSGDTWGLLFNVGTNYLTDPDSAAIINVLHGPLGFGTNNTVDVVIDDTGDVGIATTSPQAPLDVSGSIKIAQSGTETCAGAGDIGRIRVTADGIIQICRQ